jgi:hypothetical protein
MADLMESRPAATGRSQNHISQPRLAPNGAADKVEPLSDSDQRLIKFIEHHMLNPPEGSIVLTITPGVARYIIANLFGTHNRNEKERSISRYAKFMAAGAWVLNGATIVFTDALLLGDGQNRLKACIRANKPFTTDVRFGISHSAFKTMDQGSTRSAEDLLKIAGFKNCALLASATRWCAKIDDGAGTSPSYSNQQIYQLFLEKYRGVEDFLPEGRAVTRRYGNEPTGVVMALLYHFDKVDSDRAAGFAAAWAGTIVDDRFTAVLAKLETAMADIKIRFGHVHELVRVAMIINAWNATRRIRPGKGAPAIRWELPTRDKPSLFPVIV